MSLFVDACPSVTITSGTQNSPTQNTRLTHQDAVAIAISAPASAEATVIQVSRDGSTWFTLNRTTTDVLGPAATETEVYGIGCPNPPICDLYWRIRATAGNVAADRTFLVSRIWG